MQKTKLVTLLTTLNKEEWASYRKFILLYTGQESDVFAVFEFLQSRKNKLDKLETAESIAEKNFSHLSPKILLNHLSRLYQWMEEWLVIQQLKNEKYTADVLLLKALNQRGHFKQADQLFQNINQKLNNQLTLDVENSLAKSQILRIQYYSNNPIKYSLGATFLKEVVHSFLGYLNEQLLIYEAELYSWGAIQNYDFSNEIASIKAILPYLPKSDLSDTLTDLNILFEKDDVVVFNSLKDKLLNHRFEANSQLQNIVTQYIIKKANNLRNKKIRFDDDLSVAITLYDFALSHNVFNEVSDKIAAVTFRNIVSALSTFQPYETVDAFIERNISRVESKNIASTKNVLHALNCLYHDRYKDIYKYSLMKEYDDIREKIMSITILTLSTFMDRKKENALFKTTLHNLESQVKRNKAKFSSRLFKSKINLIDFLKKYDKAKNKVELYNSYETIQFRIWCERLIKGSNK